MKKNSYIPSLETPYDEQFEIRKHNLSLTSLQNMDSTNESIYDAGFINGMRYVLYQYTHQDKYKFLTEKELYDIIGIK
jgi:hypothetical protein